MFTHIQQAIKANESATRDSVAILEAVGDEAIRDLFMFDKDSVALGAENDAKIAKLVSAIPNYEELHGIKDFHKEIEKAVESMVTLQPFEG